MGVQNAPHVVRAVCWQVPHTGYPAPLMTTPLGTYPRENAARAVRGPSSPAPFGVHRFSCWRTVRGRAGLEALGLPLSVCIRVWYAQRHWEEGSGWVWVWVCFWVPWLGLLRVYEWLRG